MRKCNLNNENGRSMIEMLGVLAIIGVLSVGGIAGYSKAMMKYRINKTIEQITLIIANTQSFFTSQPDFTDLYFCSCYSTSYDKYDESKDVAKLIKKAKLFPDDIMEFDSDGNLIKANNAFGGSLLLEGDSTGAYIHIQSVPMEACIELATYDWNNINGLIAVSVLGEAPQNIKTSNVTKGCSGGTFAGVSSSVYACPNGTTIPVPIPLEKAIQACKSKEQNIFAIKFTK